MAFFDLPLPELERYLPDVAEPADLDTFWQQVLGEARAAAQAVTAERVESDLRLVEIWDVTFPGHDGAPVRAWYTRPADTGDVPLPAVVEYLGYGRGRGLPGERLTWATAGYAHLLMDSRGQGSAGSPGATPDPVGHGPAVPGMVTRGIEDPASYYFTRLITDAVRAVDAVRELPGVDPTRVTVTGNSQGGGLALAVAGLVPDLLAVMPNVPFMCHLERAVGLTGQDPYNEILRYLAVHRDAEEQVFRTLSYVDGVNLARRARAAALFSTGLQDTICPPSTVFAAYNHYGSATGGDADRQINVYKFNHHEGGEAQQVLAQLAWLAARA